MGRTFLIVEDEPMIALMLEDCLEMMGHRALPPVASLTEAKAAAAQGGFDAAIVDRHLGSEQSDGLVESLVLMGVPVLVASGGADHLPDALRSLPMLDKPFSLAELEKAIARLG